MCVLLFLRLCGYLWWLTIISVLIWRKRSLGLWHWAAQPALICLIGSKLRSKNISSTKPCPHPVTDHPHTATTTASTSMITGSSQMLQRTRSNILYLLASMWEYPVIVLYIPPPPHTHTHTHTVSALNRYTNCSQLQTSGTLQIYSCDNEY